MESLAKNKVSTITIPLPLIEARRNYQIIKSILPGEIGSGGLASEKWREENYGVSRL
jgi:hypothetical protein